MSYDLKLFEVPPGRDASSVFLELEEDDSGPSESIDDSVWQLAERLKSSWPEFVQSESQPPLRWIELDDKQLEVQILIHERSVDIAIPYFRPDASRMMQCVLRAIEAVQAERPYVAYDPQLGRTIGGSDLERMAAQYRAMDAALPGMREAGKKPWWKFW